ncbi:MAG: CHAT domain-containing protein [Alphaproteobacteria bacterium]|nr:CHAT domain-containing protein [Alphaproteobacteria bacterium]
MNRDFQLEFARVEDVRDPYAFQPGLQRYMVRLGPGDWHSVEIDWDPELLRDLQALGGSSGVEEAAARVGARLYEAMSRAGWYELALRITSALAGDDPVQVLVRSDAAEMHALPWELLQLGAHGEPLHEVHGLHLRHEWPSAGAAPSATALSASPRVLLAWSDEGGAVPHDAQLDALRESWGVEAVSELPHANPASLVEQLEQAEREGRPVELLQILAHGQVRRGVPGVALGRHLSPRDLVHALGPFAASMPLVVLAVCRGAAASSPGDRMDSLALALSRGTADHGSFSSVLAARSPLSASGSVSLTRALHRALAAGRGVDGAMSDAQRRLRLEGHKSDAAHLLLFGPHPPAAAPRPPARLRSTSGGAPPAPRGQRERIHAWARNLDRRVAWSSLCALCEAEDEHLALLVHGDLSQDLGLFTSRIEYALPHAVRTHKVFRFGPGVEHVPVKTREDWGEQLARALGDASQPPERALEDTLSRGSAFFIAGLHGPLRMGAGQTSLDEAEARGLSSFISWLPELLPDSRRCAPARFLFPAELGGGGDKGMWGRLKAWFGAAKRAEGYWADPLYASLIGALEGLEAGVRHVDFDGSVFRFPDFEELMKYDLEPDAKQRGRRLLAEERAALHRVYEDSVSEGVRFRELALALGEALPEWFWSPA